MPWPFTQVERGCCSESCQVLARRWASAVGAAGLRVWGRNQVHAPVRGCVRARVHLCTRMPACWHTGAPARPAGLRAGNEEEEREAMDTARQAAAPCGRSTLGCAQGLMAAVGAGPGLRPLSRTVVPSRRCQRYGGRCHDG